MSSPPESLNVHNEFARIAFSHVVDVVGVNLVKHLIAEGEPQAPSVSNQGIVYIDDRQQLTIAVHHGGIHFRYPLFAGIHRVTSTEAVTIVDIIESQSSAA